MEQEVKTKKIVVKKIKEVEHKDWKGKGPKWSGSVFTEAGDWINVNCFSEEDAKQKFEGVEVGKEYTVYLEGKYENVKSFVPTDSFQDPELAGKSDKQLANDAPRESMKDVVKESGGVGTPTISTNESIVRQVLYKCAAELLVKATPAKEVNEYVKELEEGFYK